MMTATLRAMATFAFFKPIRLAMGRRFAPLELDEVGTG
jgi:hypothetical protein